MRRELACTWDCRPVFSFLRAMPGFSGLTMRDDGALDAEQDCGSVGAEDRVVAVVHDLLVVAGQRERWEIFYHWQSFIKGT